MAKKTKDTTKNKGADATTSTPRVKKSKSNFTDNSAFNQRLKLLDWLFEKGSITTDQARNNLSVMSPAPRILELRRAGYLINTLPETFIDNADVKHNKTARYVLVQKMPIESDKKGGGGV